MEPIEILQNQVTMFCVEKKLNDSTRVPEFEFQQDTFRNLQRCEKLKNSIPLYYGTVRSKELLEAIEYHVNIFEKFVARLNGGELADFMAAVNSDDYSGFESWTEQFKQAQSAVKQVATLETEIKRLCVKDWKKYLTDPEEFYVKQEWQKYAFILQAVESFNPVRTLKGPAVSTSLYTDELPYTYRNRRAGVIYKLEPENLVTVAVSDSNSHVEHLTRDKEKLLSVLKWNCVENTYNLCFSEDLGSSYYPFSVFVNKCSDRIKTISDDKAKCNEVLLLPNFENDIIGVFYRWDAPAWLQRHAAEFAKMCHRPLLAHEDDGTLRLLQKM